MQSKGTKTIIMILVVLAVMFYAYTSFFSGGDTGNIVSSDQSGQNNPGVEIIAMLDRLKALKLDGKLLQSDQFKTLNDETHQIVDEPVGRNNPFAPIGRDGYFVSTVVSGNPTTTKATTTPPKAGSVKTTSQ
jgi:hypothetical protein